MKTRDDFLFYNLGPGRNLRQVHAEIEAMLEDGPLVLGLCETIGYNLRRVKDYRLIRDTTRPGRANVAAYVRADVDLKHIRFVDLDETWSRTKHDGTHPSRSLLVFFAGWMQVIVHHQPPKYTDNTLNAQWEGIGVMARLMRPWLRDGWDDRPLRSRTVARIRPRVVLQDANRTKRESGPSPQGLADMVGGYVVGKRLDCAVVRGAVARRVRYRNRFNGVRLQSDHKHGALKFRLVTFSRRLLLKKKRAARR